MQLAGTVRSRWNGRTDGRDGEGKEPRAGVVRGRLELGGTNAFSAMATTATTATATATTATTTRQKYADFGVDLNLAGVIMLAQVAARCLTQAQPTCRPDVRTIGPSS